VIYSFIVVYSFYCDLKGVKSTEDMRDTPVSPTYEYVTPTGSSTPQRPIPVPRKREHIHDVLTQTAPHNFHVTSSSNITSQTPPPLPPKTEHIYTALEMRPVRNNSDAANPEEGEEYGVYNHVLPDRFPEIIHFN
jgi:hypothetical protein